MNWLLMMRRRYQCWRWDHCWYKRKTDGVTGCTNCFKGFR